MNGGPSGFNNAHVTRALVITCFVFTVFFGVKSSASASSKPVFSFEDIYAGLRLWKLIPSVFTFSSTPELLFGLYLLYYFRVFERQIGSNKYAVFILFSIVMSSVLEFVAFAVLKEPTVKLFNPGPYGIIFASFLPFFFDIPVSTNFRVFGIRFSDKSFIYVAGFQLLFSSWKRSLLPGICGLLAGTLYRVNLFGIRKAKFPGFVASLFSRLSWPSGGSPRGASSLNVVGSSPYAGRSVERTYPSATAMAPPVEPPEGSIATLVSMGFDRNSAREALFHARNDINVATNILLEAQSH